MERNSLSFLYGTPLAFRNMFYHNLMENMSSEILINDMTADSCTALKGVWQWLEPLGSNHKLSYKQCKALTCYSNSLQYKTLTIYSKVVLTTEPNTLLVFLYGNIKNEDFCEHRLELMKAAHKYIIGGLKDAWEESLMEDIASDNVPNRLEIAWLYQLNELKKRCFKHLFECGKIYDIRDKLDDFIQGGHQELKEGDVSREDYSLEASLSY